MNDAGQLPAATTTLPGAPLYRRQRWWQLILLLICLMVLMQGFSVIQQAFIFVYRFFLLRELNLPQRYGRGSWAVITGASSGQGQQLAYQFAARGFHLLLIGSRRTRRTAEIIRRHYRGVRVDMLVKDFGRAFETDFFDDIAAEIERRDVSVLINNVGHRTGWNPYHAQPAHVIRDTIACGTVVQSRLSQIAIARFLRRKREHPALHSALVFITAQCLHSNFGFGVALSNEITVPYLAVYESSNAFGYYHACSIYQEYKGQFDILNVTPGAVITENTQHLRGTMFAVSVEQFARNIMHMLGNVQGTTCAHWGHALSTAAIALFPWVKERAVRRVGRTIAEEYMRTGYKKGYSATAK